MEKQDYPYFHRPVKRESIMSYSCRKLTRLSCLVGGLFILFFWLVHEREVSWPSVQDGKPWKEFKTYGHTQYISKEVKMGEYKVPLEAHIMSKCPDALDCLEQLIVPTMAQASSKVNFTLSFIGATSPDDSEDEITCKHGPTECLGNIIELCAAHFYPDPMINLGFTLCLSKKYDEIPGQNLVHDCALEHGMDFEVLNDCASKDNGAFGMRLLRDSVLRSQEANASISCTVRLNGKSRCVRDGGVWKNCERGSSPKSLVQDIEDIWEGANKKVL